MLLSSASTPGAARPIRQSPGPGRPARGPHRVTSSQLGKSCRCGGPQAPYCGRAPPMTARPARAVTLARRRTFKPFFKKKKNSDISSLRAKFRLSAGPGRLRRLGPGVTFSALSVPGGKQVDPGSSELGSRKFRAAPRRLGDSSARP